jgi:hypothetical protein
VMRKINDRPFFALHNETGTILGFGRTIRDIRLVDVAGAATLSRCIPSAFSRMHFWRTHD